jgi:hypothetical protein
MTTHREGDDGFKYMSICERNGEIDEKSHYNKGTAANSWPMVLEQGLLDRMQWAEKTRRKCNEIVASTVQVTHGSAWLERQQ